MEKILSYKLYNYNRDYFAAEIELRVNPALINKDDISVNGLNASAIVFLDKTGVRAITENDEFSSDEDYSRIAAVFPKNRSGGIYNNIRTIYGEYDVEKVERYPERLEKVVKFATEQGEIARAEKRKKATEADLIAEAESGTAEALIKIIDYYTYDKKDIDKRLKRNLELIEKYPDKALYSNLYALYIDKLDEENAFRYLKEGLKYNQFNCYGICGVNSMRGNEFQNAVKYFTTALAIATELRKEKPKESGAYWYGADDDYIIERSYVKYLIDIYFLNPKYLTGKRVVLAKALGILSDYGMVMAQFLLALLYGGGSYGADKIEAANKLYFKCLEHKKQYLFNNEFNIIYRRRAIEGLLKIALKDPETAQYAEEYRFIYEYADGKYNFGQPMYEGSLGFEYQTYMKATDPSLIDNPYRKKELYNNMASHLCYAATATAKIKNGMNYYIYWLLKSKTAGNDETVYIEWLGKSYDFSKNKHKEIMSAILAKAKSGDAESLKIIEICKSEYPYLLTSAKPEKIKNMRDSAKTADSKMQPVEDDLTAYAVKCFKDKNYAAAKSAFENALNGESDIKKLKTANKYLAKIYGKGLGVEKDNYAALKYKNNMKTL